MPAELDTGIKPDWSVRSQQTMKEMRGVCFLFSETCTEGGWWAMQEDGFVVEDGHWKYEGLQYLREGDDFTVYANSRFTGCGTGR